MCHYSCGLYSGEYLLLLLFGYQSGELVVIPFLTHILEYPYQQGIITGGLIHKLEKQNKDDHNHNALVREFSLQVAHEPITISANGFFNIDFSLLGSMAAATVTYLVILIQFQQSEKSKATTT